MNPKVSEYASNVGFDVADFTWFDLSNINELGEQELIKWGEDNIPEWKNNKSKIIDFVTPCEKMAIIHPQLSGTVVTYEKYGKINDYEGALVCMWSQDLDESPMAFVTDVKDSSPPEYYVKAQKKYFGDKGEAAISNMFSKACLAALNVATLLNMRAHKTDEVLIAHNAKGLDFINRKRRAKHQPLLYSWTTIELKPSPQVKQEHKGGSHASPARHKRRGHLRKKRDGSFTWIPEMWVGSIENGLIVHDYIADKKLKVKE